MSATAGTGLAIGASGNAEVGPAQQTRLFSIVLSNIYFMLFTWQIFSPTYFGFTIYLECFVAVLNPDFLVWLVDIKLKRSAVVAFLVLCAAYMVTDPASVAATIFTAITVLYLVFAFETRTFFFYRYLLISIFVAIAQYYLLQHDLAQALQIGPTALAHDVWGSHATATYSNFYAVVGNVTRVSGLSREAGFFASLLVEAICLYAVARGRSKVVYLLFAVAFYISLSKVSFVIIGLVIVIRARDWLSRIPWPPVLVAWIGALYLFAHAERGWLLASGHGTYLSRFGAILQFPYLTLSQWFHGTPMAGIASPITNNFVSQGLEGKGVPGFIILEGVIVFAAYLMFWAASGIRTAGVLFLCLASLNETFRTCQNYVSLGYFFALYLLPALTSAKALGVRLSPRGVVQGSLIGLPAAPRVPSRPSRRPRPTPARPRRIPL